MLKTFGTISERAAAIALKRPVVTMIAVGLVALASAVIALGLNPETGVESITGTDSKTYEATQEFSREFGGDPIVVLIRGELPRIVLGPDLAVLAGLEGCLSGNIPNSARARSSVPQVCRDIAKLKPAVAVYGPGTFVNTAVGSVNEGIDKLQQRSARDAREAADTARKLAAGRGKTLAEQEAAADAAEQLAQLQSYSEALRLGREYGLSQRPALNNQGFVAQLVFDARRGADTPKGRFAYVFPNKRSAVIQVRLRPDLTPDGRADAIALVRRAIASPRYQLQNGSYLVTGAPVVINGVQDSISKAVVTLLGGALIVMALVLLLVFPAELRLLPLALALLAAALTYGLLALTGSKIGVGAVAVLPVLVGLAVDYAIQFHARADDAMRAGATAGDAVLKAARTGGPPVLAAALATISALLALELSPVPVVRGFGLLLVAGVALAITVVLTAGFATLGWAGGVTRQRPRRRLLPVLIDRLRLRQAFSAVVARPGKVVMLACLLAAAGWVAGLTTPVTTDIRQLVPASLDAVSDIETLQRSTGASGEISVLVKAGDVTDPAVIGWMRKYQARVLADAGYRGESPQCGLAKLCPALSLTELFAKQRLTKRKVRSLLRSVGDFRRAVVNDERTMATMAFGLQLQSLTDQKELVDSMRDRLDPPKGVSAEIVGLSALAADAGNALSSQTRRIATIGLALLLVSLVLLMATGGVGRAIPAILTIVLSGGISALLLWLIRVALNPMSAALSVFIIAIASEFTLLICLRYLRCREEQPGLDIAAAYRDAYREIGPAVFASGVTAIAGFAALALSDIGMLRGFALVAIVDLAVALAGTVLLLPAVTIWVDSGFSPRRSRRPAARSYDEGDRSGPEALV